MKRTSPDLPTSKEEVPRWSFEDLVSDLTQALAKSTDLSLSDLSQKRFPITVPVQERLEEVLHELQFGTGAALLQFPADWLLEQGEEGSQRAFLGLCAHLGRPVTQSTDLQELCARVEVARSPEVLEAKHTQRRGYRNAQDQFLHNDSSIPAARGQGVCDVLAMLCFRPARSGGLSKMASARKIHELLQQQPRVLESVRHGFKYDAASVEYHPDWRQPPTGQEARPMVFEDVNGFPCVQYAKNMVETISAAYAKEGGELDSVKALLKNLEDACSDPAVVQYWDLKAGEAYLVDNYRWLHARTHFEDDAAAPRLFFRLWLQVADFERQKTRPCAE